MSKNNKILNLLVLCFIFISTGTGCVVKNLIAKNTAKSATIQQKKQPEWSDWVHSWAFKIAWAGKYSPITEFTPEAFKARIRQTESQKIALMPINTSSFFADLFKITIFAGTAMLGATDPSSSLLSNTVDNLVMMDTLAKLDKQSEKELRVKKRYFGATMFAWMPAEMAQNATEARAKLATILEQAYYNATREDVEYQQKEHWRLFDYFNPHEVIAFSLPVKQQIPDIVANATGLSGDAWVWNFKDSPILFYLCNIINHAHSQYVQVEYDDLSFYSKVSRLLPKWCFIYLPFKYNSRWFARLHSDGEKFLLMPRLLWQGKSHFFIAKPAKHKQQTQAAQ